MESLILCTLFILGVLLGVLLYRVVRIEQYIKSKLEAKVEPEYYDDTDPMLPAAKDIAMSNGKISAAFLQRRLKIGFARSARLLVAPRLTVVSAPLRYEAFQRMRGTPTLLGWGPASRWDMKR